MNFGKLADIVFETLDFLSEKSGFQRLAGAVAQRQSSIRKSRAWVPRSIIPTNQGDESELANLCIHLHYFHEKYLKQIVAFTNEFRDAGKIVITSPSDQLLVDLRQVVRASNVKFELVANRGRNFGALLQIFSEISKCEFILHLHTKNTREMSMKRNEEWSRLFWDELGEKKNIIRILNVFRTRDSISIGYPDLSSVLSTRAFSWGRNKKIAQALFPEFSLIILFQPTYPLHTGLPLCLSGPARRQGEDLP
jgi:lipopolysaccharide biosynthesis protein